MTAPAPDGGIEIESLDQLDERLASGKGLAECSLQSLDLTGHGEALLAADVTRAMFLGCDFGPGVEHALERRGALVFPTLPDLPFNPYRSGLYTADELYAGLESGYRYTLDARNYRWWKYVGRHRSLTSELAMTLHDHAISEALDDVGLQGAVGVMGGHQLVRGAEGYTGAARLGRALAASGRTVITGGGPGAMEAVNLGAALVGTEAELDAALALLAERPRFAEDIASWVGAGMAVRDRWELGGRSYGIPTWLYGHEPPNVFSAGIAKLFSNAIREDVLLRHASGGLVCLPGAAGTVQEVFQAVTPRFYAAPDEPIPPLVLVGIDYWTRVQPAWPLLTALADARPMATAIHLVETAAEVPALLG
ncbi:MAG: Rossmann fold nucleotide-binding protein [Actinobacteria bacterium HGW-Actinobacteria-5]|jgi:predicted Rossmann-fold nucleotide-binding protein|nr:MAG: Rossmann fold nucleotide-binding protein [Actinobacteria bacterium HGW-Actinobacteria-5]